MTAAGIHRVPMAEYHAWDAASNSRLSLLARSPAHCRAAIDEPFADTEALAFGRAVHTAVLEPEEFSARYVTPRRCYGIKRDRQRCSNKGSVLMTSGEWYCGTHATSDASYRDTAKEVLSSADWDACQSIRESIHGIPRAKDLIEHLDATEVSLRWTDQETGVPCKARLDGYSEELGVIVDLKTTRDARPKESQKAIANYGYHRQGALYIEGAAFNGINARHYVIIAVEKTRPYAAAIYRLTEGAIDQGADEIRVLLRRYAECLETGEWPGYGDDVTDIGLPEWAQKEAL